MNAVTDYEQDVHVPNSDSSVSYRILFLEDNPDDVELIKYELSEAGLRYKSVSVEKKKEFINIVKEFSPTIILADYSLPAFNGIEAFQMLKEEKINIPFILVTGALSEQMALQCMKDGIDDFVLKSNFKRLPQAIVNAVEKKKIEREKIRIAQELKKSHKELRLLLNRHQLTVEEERMIIARDLHDELGQVLTALKMGIMILWKNIASRKIITKDRIDAEFGEIVEMVDKISKSVKSISAGLRPETLDELGFFEAVKIHAMEFARRSKIKCRTFLPKDNLNIDKNLAIALFRIAQEALTNIARHAEASAAEIRVSTIIGHIHLRISDNGKGITDSEINSSQSLGIIGIRERVKLLNGEFKIGHAEGGGTLISVVVPLI